MLGVSDADRLGPEGFLEEIAAKSHAGIDEWQTEEQVKAMRVGAMHLYSDGVLTDGDVSALLSQACASPSNDLSMLIEDFMTRCVLAPCTRCSGLAPHFFFALTLCQWRRGAAPLGHSCA